MLIIEENCKIIVFICNLHLFIEIVSYSRVNNVVILVIVIAVNDYYSGNNNG